MPDLPTLASRPVTIIGAGTLGRLIGLTLATRGGVVRLYDPSPDAVADAQAFIGSQLDGVLAMFSAQAREGHSAGIVETYGDLPAAVSGAGLIIEAAPENVEVKRRLLAELDLLAAPDAIVASNSSSIPVSTFVSDLTHPERVLNVHFHNPPWVPAVDLLSSGETRRDIIAHLEAELPRYGLLPFEANGQATGFPMNRLIEAFAREAIQIVLDGASTPEKVDAMWTADMGMAYGPFGLLDIIGLDVHADIERIRRQENPLLENWKVVEALEPYLAAGKLGVKTGEGFFRYDDAGKRIS